MRRTITAAVAASAFAWMQGCGGSAASKPAAAPSAPAPEAPSGAKGASADGAQPESSTASPALREPSAAPPPSSAAAQSAGAAEDPRGGRRAFIRRAGAEIDAAQRQIETSAGDCAAACRALGSMERAAGHLCDLAADQDDRRSCEEAKTRVQAARDRVRTTCGGCPGGPSVERAAPIPSR